MAIRDASGHPAAPGPRGRRVDLWLPLAYAALAGAWIALSDLLVASRVRSVAAQTAWSIAKGIGFVVVTALLLHLAVRWALARERRAYRRLAESEALLRTITDSIPDPVFLKDRQSRWLFGNPAALRVAARPAAEVLGKDDREIYPAPGVGEALVRADQRIMASGVAEVVEEDIASASGRRLFLSTKLPLRDAAGQVIGVLGVARDVTEQRRLERQLQQAAKLESIGQLAGGVAHDFNNLLTVILSCAEALKGDLAAGRVTDPELVAEIATAGERAREVTRQLLAFARRQVIRPVPLDLNALVRGTERLLRRVLGEHVQVITRLQPDLGTVRCDPGQLEQVILNLAVNARDAMPDGGTLTLETANAHLDGPQLAAHPFLRAGAFVRLVIRDSGRGMPPEVKAHAFEPFFTTKPKGEGTGLGLATVYGIVKQSDGYILLDSEPGRGTSFELYFPRSAEAATAPAADSPRAATTRGAETLLVVEDDPLVRDVTVRALRGAGYRVLVAGCGADALALDPGELRGAQLLVTDVVMPGLGGRALADELRRRHPALRVLFVSGYAQDDIARRGVLDSDIDFLPKPFTPAVLLARVRAVLDDGGRVSPPC